MKKQFFALFVVLFLIHPLSAVNAARSIVISSDKVSLVNEEEMIVSASVSGFTSGEKIYLKGAFYLEGSSNYFGYTKKIEQWVSNNENVLNQTQIEIGTWDQKVLIRGDYLDSGFDGKGEYNFKLGYYYFTASGNLSSINWSENILKINLDPPKPTDTPTPTVKPDQNISAPSLISPTLTQSFSKTPTPILTHEKIAYSTKSSNFDKIQSINDSSVRNKANDDSKDQKGEEIKVLGASDKQNFSWLWIGTGGVFFIFGAGFYIYKIAKDKGII